MKAIIIMALPASYKNNSNCGWVVYAYNNEYFQSDNLPKRKQVVNKKDPYIEAIVDAVYYDSGFDKTKEWIIEWLLPLLEKYRIND